MKIQTRDFGELEIDEREIFTFRQPVYGFEHLSRYVFLYDKDFNEHFVWLQSLEDPDIRFILVDPATVTDSYPPALPDELQAVLEAGECVCWLVVVIREPFQDSTVNLKSPIVVNPERKLGAQVILEEDMPIRFPLFGAAKEGGVC